MIDWARVVGFQWDEGNSRKSVDKHGVGQSEAEQVFFGEPLVVVEDIAHSRNEARYHGLGTTAAGRRLHITFTLRENATRIRVISARDMSQKERSLYAKAP
jgi:uncharacterized DUF497 family protein